MPPSRAKLELLAAQLKTLSEAIGGEASGGLSAQRVNRVRHTITEAYEQLRRVTEYRGGPRNWDSLLRWDPDQGEGIWNTTAETELSC